MNWQNFPILHSEGGATAARWLWHNLVAWTDALADRAKALDSGMNRSEQGSAKSYGSRCAFRLKLENVRMTVHSMERRPAAEPVAPTYPA